MPKFSTLAIEQPPIRKLPFKLQNSGQDCKVGIQVLPAGARLEAIELARQHCKRQGVESWDDKDPTCSLEFWIEVVARATVTAESESGNAEQFFDSADQVRNDRRIGSENIAYLYEAYEQHEAEYSIRPTKLSTAEAMALCIELASRDEESLDGFLGGMGPGTLKSLVRSMAGLFASLLQGNSPSVSEESSSATTSETSTSTSSEAS